VIRLDAIAARGAAHAPDRTAITVPEGAGHGASMTYGELDRAASAFAASLHTRGAALGDRLILANANTPAFFVALLGAARAGLVAVPLDPSLARAELAAVLDHARPHAVVIDERSAPVFESLDAPLCAVSNDSGSSDVAATGCAPAAPGGDTQALILYTSGTTGTPRGAVHSHAGILQKVEDIRAWFGLGGSDSELCLLPTYFGHGLVCACLTTLHFGGTLHLCRPFDAELLPRVFALADHHGITTFSTVPTIVRLLLRNAAIAAPSSGRLRFVTCASAPLHPEEALAFEARFGVPLVHCYGLTEAGTWSAMSPIGRMRDPDRDHRSVGVAVGCRFRVVAPSKGDGGDCAPPPPGEIGEIEIAGPSVMLGYDRDPEATARVLHDGWLATGDLGRIDDRGRVYLAGRAKELIIRAGANIYPAEVERVLLHHPGVAEAYVVGLDHALLGEQVAACVVPRNGAALSNGELVRHCRTQLAPYKCPETFRFVHTVPRTSRGKVSRATLRELLAASAMPLRAWSTIDDFLGAILDQTVSSAELQHFVIVQWNAKRFAFCSDAMVTWLPRVAALAETASVTYHGRSDQPVCPSRHLFGDPESIAARVVLDPPNTLEHPESIEFHAHPVDSLIVVLRGGGNYHVCHRGAAGSVVVAVPLMAGTVICFPRDVIHTIECGREGIETLNITSRLNQPAWRDDPTLQGIGAAASSDFARACDPPAGAPTVAYVHFERPPIPGLL
jgi:long-chain acyl-CoA synthetase